MEDIIKVCSLYELKRKMVIIHMNDLPVIFLKRVFVGFFKVVKNSHNGSLLGSIKGFCRPRTEKE